MTSPSPTLAGARPAGLTSAVGGAQIDHIALAHPVGLADTLLALAVEDEAPLPLAGHRHPDGVLGAGRDQLLVAHLVPQALGYLLADPIVIAAAVTLAVVVEDAGISQDGHR